MQGGPVFSRALSCWFFARFSFHACWSFRWNHAGAWFSVCSCH